MSRPSKCLHCGKSLEGKRAGAKWCDKNCQMKGLKEQRKVAESRAEGALVMFNRNENGGSRGPKPKIDPELVSMITQAILMGWEPHVAAQAAGVGYDKFRWWMRRGEKQKKGVYKDFFDAISRASALARGVAGQQVWTHQPLEWLKRVHRDRPGEPGWSDSAAAVGGAGEGKAAILELVKHLRGD